MRAHVGATVVVAAVVLLAGCAGSGGTDTSPSVSTSTKTATETVTSKPKTKTTTKTATQTVTETVTATAPASAPAAPQAPAPTSTTPAGNTTVGPDGVTYEIPTTDQGFEGWCSRLEIPEEVRAPHCMAG